MTAPLVIAAIYAHPDDGEFFAAGSLAKWRAAGHRVVAVCATDGSLGTRHADRSRKEVARERAAELTAALACLGLEPPIMLGFPDGELREHADALKERLVFHLRCMKVDRMLTFDPWRRYEIHPDHVTVGRVACEAAAFSCFPLLFPHHLSQVGLEPRQPREVWFMTPTEHAPNRVVDIAPTFEAKIRSFLCHRSQVELLANWFAPDADDPWQIPHAELERGARNLLEKMARVSAKAARNVELAEAFYVQRVGPGHLSNFDDMLREMVGATQQVVEVE
ncbi:MAG: PIG-L deacetylase family protein [Polyangiaceae bacterium]